MNLDSIEQIVVLKKNELKELCEDESLAIPGVIPDEKTIVKIFYLLKDEAELKRLRIFIIKGNVINKIYKLKQYNRYNDNFHILAIKNEDVISNKPLENIKLGYYTALLNNLLYKKLKINFNDLSFKDELYLRRKD